MPTSKKKEKEKWSQKKKIRRRRDNGLLNALNQAFGKTYGKRILNPLGEGKGS